VAKRRAKAKPPKAEKPAKDTLTTVQTLFALTYIANGCNALRAYQAAHPNAAISTCGVEGHRTLHIPKVTAFIQEELNKKFVAAHMEADEVVARVSMDARADLTMLYDEEGKLLEPYQWSTEFRNSVESYERTENGGFKIKLVSKGNARRAILEMTGKLKNPLAGGLSDLARAIREDIAEAEK
jgi:phage terminase small subunit